MATELGSAFISVGLGTNSLAGDIKKAFGSAESEGGSAGKSAGGGFGKAFGLATAALGAIGIGSFFKSAVSGAADLEQSVGAVDSVFKGSAGQMHEWAKSAATDVGLSANEFSELGTLIGSQLKNGGTAMDELAPKTKSLISTGADLASMFGGTTSEAVAALSSALKGERDPIERYGVSLNQAKIDAEAAALGFKKVDGALSAEANQAATLSLIMKQTADAHGNFASEADTLAHKQQVLNAQLANGKARIGTELLPVVAALTGALSKALGPAIDITVASIKEVVGGFTAFGAAFKAADGDITSSGFAGVMERLGFAASKLADIGKTLWAGMREFFGGLGAAIGPLLSQIIPLASAFSPMQIIFSAIQPLLPQLLDMFLQLASVLGGSLLVVLTNLTPMFVQLSGVVSEALGGVIAAVLPTVVTMITMLGTTLSQLIPIIVPIITTLVQLATTLISQLMPIIMNLVASILPPLVDIFGNILSAIGPVISMIAGLLIPIITALMPVVVTVFGVVADVIKSAMQIVMGIIQVVTGIISGNWAQVWAGMLNILGGVLDLIINLISGVFQMVISVIGAALGVVVAVFTSTWSGIVSYLGAAFASIINGAGQMGQDLLNFFGGLGGSIIGALGNIGETLFNSGRALIQGFIDGISGMIGAVTNAVGGVLGAVADFFPHSPAKKGPFSGRGYTTYSGAALAGDFADSIAAQRSRVEAAAGLVTSAAVLSGSMVPAGALSGSSAQASSESGTAAGLVSGPIQNNIQVNGRTLFTVMTQLQGQYGSR